MRDILDTHTHTLASGHAYSTIRENTRAAFRKGLELLAITEHAPCLIGSCQTIYFQNLRVVDRNAYEVELLMGVELNILDQQGNVDLEVRTLRQMDVAIASLHTPCFTPGSREYNTQACINAMRNPYVNILGHPDDPRYPVDFRALVQAAKEHEVLLELNNSSLRPGGSRKNARGLDMEMLKLCMEYEAPIVIGSDAHVDTDVGRHDEALALLEELEFPESLVVNRSVEELKKYVNRFRK
ncbi:MAG: phosphatase [Lachnospiraceae bacterium]|nr:phosphatase [Lachnospiraceae bacterium]